MVKRLISDEFFLFVTKNTRNGLNRNGNSKDALFSRVITSIRKTVNSHCFRSRVQGRAIKPQENGSTSWPGCPEMMELIATPKVLTLKLRWKDTTLGLNFRMKLSPKTVAGVSI